MEILGLDHNDLKQFGRIVDFLDKFAWEAKSGKYVTLGGQLRDLINNFKDNFRLVVSDMSKLSIPLLKALDKIGAKLYTLSEDGKLVAVSIAKVIENGGKILLDMPLIIILDEVPHLPEEAGGDIIDAGRA